MTGRLLAMRLRWYSEATARVLLRRWQTILVLVGTLAPVGGSLLAVASYPVLVLLETDHGVVWRLGAIGMWQGCWALWALMQQDQLRGGRFAEYLRALPIPAHLQRCVDSIVLLVGNTPLLIPFVAAGMALGMQELPVLETVRGGLLMAFLLATQWCAQHEVLNGRGRALPALVTIDIWAAFALGLPVAGAVALMTPAVAVSVWALLTDVPAPSRRPGSALGLLAAVAERLFGAAVGFLPPSGRLSLGILYRQHRSTMLGTFFGCLLVTFAARGLMRVWEFDNRCLPMVLIVFGILALAVSGLYRPLQMAHEAARPYTAALPLRPRWWVRADTTSILTFALPFAAALAAPLWLDAGVPLRSAAAAVGSFLVLIVLLRVPQLFSNRHAVVASTTLAAGWTFAAATFMFA